LRGSITFFLGCPASSEAGVASGAGISAWSAGAGSVGTALLSGAGGFGLVFLASIKLSICAAIASCSSAAVCTSLLTAFSVGAVSLLLLFSSPGVTGAGVGASPLLGKTAEAAMEAGSVAGGSATGAGVEATLSSAAGVAVESSETIP